MRGPHVYDIRNGMNFRDTNDLEPIHLRVSPSNSRYDNEDIQRQNGRYYNTRDTPPKSVLQYLESQLKTILENQHYRITNGSLL